MKEGADELKTRELLGSLVTLVEHLSGWQKTLPVAKLP